ncbi:MAG: DUF4330 domain-containing protein [Clostridia bacterium]|nr:DUF4330 domain-containing protein [Clostridia bacterium]
MKKINVVDIVILLLLILCVGGIAIRFSGTKDLSATKIEYTLKLKGVRDYSVTALEKKGNVYDPKLKKQMGTIVDVAVEDAVGEEKTADGRNVIAPIPERYDVTLTIQTDGSVGESAYYSAASNELCVGKTYEMYTKWSSCYGTIERVTVLE